MGIFPEACQVPLAPTVTDVGRPKCDVSPIPLIVLNVITVPATQPAPDTTNADPAGPEPGEKDVVALQTEGVGEGLGDGVGVDVAVTENVRVGRGQLSESLMEIV